MSKAIKLIFTASILFNMLFVGLIASDAYQKYTHNKERKKAQMEKLSEEGQDIVSETFREVRENKGEMIREALQRRRDLADILSGESFDIEAYDDLTNQMLEDQQLIAKNKIKIVRTLATELNYDDRKVIARKMSGILSGAKQGSKRRHKGSEQGAEELNENRQFFRRMSEEEKSEKRKMFERSRMLREGQGTEPEGKIRQGLPDGGEIPLPPQIRGETRGEVSPAPIDESSN